MNTRLLLHSYNNITCIPIIFNYSFLHKTSLLSRLITGFLKDKYQTFFMRIFLGRFTILDTPLRAMSAVRELYPYPRTALI